jgi:hypothetical protein
MDFTTIIINYINSFFYINRDYLIVEDHLTINNFYLIYIICIKYTFIKQKFIYLTIDEFNSKYTKIFNILFIFNVYYLLSDIARRIFMYLHNFFFFK